MVATFNVKLAPTFRNYVAEQDKIMPNFLQSFQFFGSTPPDSKFSRVFFYLLKRLSWLLSMKRCTYFEMICSWVRGQNSKFIKYTRIFLIGLLRFCLGKVVCLIVSILRVFLPLKKLWWFSMNRVHLLLENIYLKKV